MKQCCYDTFTQAFEEVISFLEQKHITSIEDVIGSLKGSVNMLKKAKREQFRRAGITDDNNNL
jgi:hypothetical protein